MLRDRRENRKKLPRFARIRGKAAKQQAVSQTVLAHRKPLSPPDPVARPVEVAVVAPEAARVDVAPRPAAHNAGASGRRLRGIAAPPARRRPRVVPIRAPLPDVSTHLEQAPGAAALRIAPDGAGRLGSLVLSVPAALPILPAIAPGIFAAVQAARAILPLQLGRQAQPGPGAVGARIVPAHADHRMVRLPWRKRAAAPYRRAVFCRVRRPMARRPHEPQVLRVGHGRHREVVGGEPHREALALAGQEFALGDARQDGAVLLVFDEPVGHSILSSFGGAAAAWTPCRGRLAHPWRKATPIVSVRDGDRPIRARRRRPSYGCGTATPSVSVRDGDAHRIGAGRRPPHTCATATAHRIGAGRRRPSYRCGTATPIVSVRDGMNSFALRPTATCPSDTDGPPSPLGATGVSAHLVAPLWSLLGILVLFVGLFSFRPDGAGCVVLLLVFDVAHHAVLVGGRDGEGSIIGLPGEPIVGSQTLRNKARRAALYLLHNLPQR